MTSCLLFVHYIDLRAVFPDIGNSACQQVLSIFGMTFCTVDFSPDG